jgi:hypothetical protein
VNGRQADIGAFDTPKLRRRGQRHRDPHRPRLVRGRQRRGIRQRRRRQLPRRAAGSSPACASTSQNARPASACSPTRCPTTRGLKPGTEIHRNRDQAFERLLEKDSAERRIAITLDLARNRRRLPPDARDEDGISASATVAHAKEAAKNPPRAFGALAEGLGKLGATDFRANAR